MRSDNDYRYPDHGTRQWPTAAQSQAMQDDSMLAQKECGCSPDETCDLCAEPTVSPGVSETYDRIERSAFSDPEE